MFTGLGKFCKDIIAILLGPRGQLLAILSAGPMTFFMCAWLVQIVASSHWPVTLRDHQLTILGYSLFACLGLVYVVILALSAGLIKGVRLKAGNIIDASVDLDEDEESPK